MMQGRMPLAIAAVFALLAGLVAYLAVEERTREISSQWEPVEVISAARDLKRGDRLNNDNLDIGFMVS